MLGSLGLRRCALAARKSVEDHRRLILHDVCEIFVLGLDTCKVTLENPDSVGSDRIPVKGEAHVTKQIGRACFQTGACTSDIRAIAPCEEAVVFGNSPLGANFVLALHWSRQSLLPRSPEGAPIDAMSSYPINKVQLCDLPSDEICAVILDNSERIKMHTEFLVSRVYAKLGGSNIRSRLVWLAWAILKTC